MLVTRLAAYCAAASILAGCAMGRDVVDVKTPQATNPVMGKLVRIEPIVDARKFEVAPSSADIPSLDPDLDASDDTKARAIGRKRGGFGKAFGDVVLPEGHTVSGLVEGAVTAAFQESGYKVLKKGDPEYDAAAPIKTDVTEFWAWFSPGFWSVQTNHKSQLEVSGGPLPFPKTVTTKVSESHQVVTTDDWREIVEKGLAAITAQTKKILSPGTTTSAR